MSASLVGSEMCIRDRFKAKLPVVPTPTAPHVPAGAAAAIPRRSALSSPCLLYTSDAADDM
eukprot:11635749-Alexandrium_andersonii.AAC.1